MSKTRQLLLTTVIAVALAGGIATSASASNGQALVMICEQAAFGYIQVQVPEDEVDEWLAGGAVLPDEYGVCPAGEPGPGQSPFVTFFRELFGLIFHFLAAVFGGLFGGHNVGFSR